MSPQKHAYRHELTACACKDTAASQGFPSFPLTGMAGSGKTTLIQRINSYLHTHKRPCYLINLDPAVTHVPYEPNIDIRDTVSVTNGWQWVAV